MSILWTCVNLVTCLTFTYVNHHDAPYIRTVKPHPGPANRAINWNITATTSNRAQATKDDGEAPEPTVGGTLLSLFVLIRILLNKIVGSAGHNALFRESVAGASGEEKVSPLHRVGSGNINDEYNLSVVVSAVLCY